MTPAPMPRAAQPFVTFGTRLRGHGFAVAPEQILAFLAGVELLGPRRLGDIRHAARATLAPPPERLVEFDALFDAHFLGGIRLATDAEAGADDDEVRIQDDTDALIDLPPDLSLNEAGAAATAAEILTSHRLAMGDEDAALRRLVREAPRRLPPRRGYRWVTARRGSGLDLRRGLRRAVRHDGEVLQLARLRRKPRQRAILLLIDVSGSMKAHSERALRFAHALSRAAQRIEVFTLGTRLTRITKALQRKDRVAGLEAAAASVADWDGGTRLGDTLQAFLAVPRFAGYARGAVVLVLSDGLERGDPATMIAAVAALSRRAWRLAWLTPLAADPAFRPDTEALRQIMPFLDDLADGGSTERLCSYVLGLSERRTA